MSDDLYEVLGRSIRGRRELLGLSQSALASHVSMARTSITNIESGGQNLMMHQFFDIARALCVSPVELLETANELHTAPREDQTDPKLEDLLMKLTAPVRASRV